MKKRTNSSTMGRSMVSLNPRISPLTSLCPWSAWFYVDSVLVLALDFSVLIVWIWNYYKSMERLNRNRASKYCNPSLKTTIYYYQPCWYLMPLQLNVYLCLWINAFQPLWQSCSPQLVWLFLEKLCLRRFALDQNRCKSHKQWHPLCHYWSNYYILSLILYPDTSTGNSENINQRNVSIAKI